jgi:hypothetical protein
MRALAIVVGIAGCATAPANPCSMATDHVAACTDEAPAFRTGACNEHRAELLLDMSCDDLRSVATAARAGGWWDPFLCSLQFADHCDADTPRMVLGVVHRADETTPAVNVWVRAIWMKDTREVRGGWTFAGGLYAIRELRDNEPYRIEVALSPTGATLGAVQLGPTDPTSFVALAAPIP